MIRSAAILAGVLVLALAGGAMAKPGSAAIHGRYTYFVVAEDPATYRTIALNAQLTADATGTWSASAPWGSLSGSITCVQVDGTDAWLAGPVDPNDLGAQAVFFWVRDGGAPGRTHDLAFTWFADAAQSVAEMEAACQSKSTDLFGGTPLAVTSGNISVR